MVDTPTADSPREPDITHVNPATGDTWFGHPRQLARLFTTEMWERFGYYGMRALLMLYLTKHFIFSDGEAAGLYGGYTALVYLTPLIGGYLADQYLGSKRSVKFGAIVMAIGYFTLAFGGTPSKPYAVIDGHRYEVQVDNFRDGPTSAKNEKRMLVDGTSRYEVKGNEDGTIALLNADGSVSRTIPKGGLESKSEKNPFNVAILLLALSLISVGNGFFKPNISTMVGELYARNDGRRDAGFTIFYMGINLGSILGQLACPFLADWIGWPAGLACAGVGMLISWTLIQFNGGRLDSYGEPPVRIGPDRTMLIYICAVVAVPLFYLLFQNVLATPRIEAGGTFGAALMALPLLNKMLYITFFLSVPGILIWTWVAGDRREFQMMVVAMVLITFNVVFWTLFEQAGSSLTLFADRNTNLHVIGNWSLSAPQTQNFNPISVVLFAPVLSLLWAWLAKRKLEPSIPVKFAIALMGVGGGFLFLVWGSTFAGPDFKVGLWWIAGLYLIHSLAELCISPVGLSMITKLSLARIVGLMMGVWFLSISVAQSLAGLLAQSASVETVGGQVTNPKVSLDTYTTIYQHYGLITVGIGLLLLLLSPLIKKWMHGVN
ncbi:peptide MFS transporter [Sphingomonas sp. RT2P30]|uniref:peptide MFS transporter n=1 Tax=Parasphingomonas halimpatiens TaxID=3096162 RepID=UPI002FC93008